LSNDDAKPFHKREKQQVETLDKTGKEKPGGGK
jgi:hypothetical protein